MKRALPAMLALLLLVPLTLAQEVEPAAGKVELNKLYKQIGRTWTHRVIRQVRGSPVEVSTSKFRVNELTETTAFVEEVLSKPGEDDVPLPPMEVPLSEPVESVVAGDLPQETLDMGFRKFPCRKRQVKTKESQTTTWTSTEYHPLVVKQVTFEGTTCTVCKLTAFQTAEVDPWLLYRKQGRRFKMKGEGGGKLNYFESTITKISENSAEMTVKQTDAEGKLVGEAKTQTVEFTKRMRLVVPEGVDEVKPTGEETISVEAGEFDCYIVELELGKKRWKMLFSKTWLELPVKVEFEAGTLELVEFDLGHDSQAFYRTVGNSYTQDSRVKTRGFNHESRMRYEITAVTEDESTFKMTSLDANGKVLFSNESTMELFEREEGAALLSYSGEVEELLETPAGRFPAIRTTSDDMEFWMWNGLMIKIEMKSRDVESNSEITELTMQ